MGCKNGGFASTRAPHAYTNYLVISTEERKHGFLQSHHTLHNSMIINYYKSPFLCIMQIGFI